VISRRRLAALSAWLGMALAALFLYPLAVALDSDLAYMQWQARDTIEAVAAFVLLSVVFGALVAAVWRRSGYLSTVALIAIAALPLLSFLAGLSRQLPFEDALIGAWENRLLRYGLPVAAAATLAGLFLLMPATFDRWLRRGLLAVSFVAFVVLLTFTSAAATDHVPVSFDRAAAPRGDRPACPSIVALLFDELSFAYVYDGGEIRQEFPALRRLSAIATNYLDVRAPADETLVALPAYLAARHIERVSIERQKWQELTPDGQGRPLDLQAPDSLFGTARRLGLTTEIGGYYLPYCALLADAADVCRSLSFYNASAPEARFSPFHPILTTLVMWPRQFPFGLVKSPAFAQVQRGLVNALDAFARRPLPPGRPVFRFVHFSVPHLPFTFDASGYNPSLNPLRTSPDTGYVRQVQFVDRLLGRMITEMDRAGTFENAMLIVFADHGFRFGGRERDPLHVPFIVKRPRQRVRVDVTGTQRGELLLQQLVAGACAAS
jgi:hypothetical protein